MTDLARSRSPVSDACPTRLATRPRSSPDGDERVASSCAMTDIYSSRRLPRAPELGGDLLLAAERLPVQGRDDVDACELVDEPRGEEGRGEEQPRAHVDLVAVERAGDLVRDRREVRDSGGGADRDTEPERRHDDRAEHRREVVDAGVGALRATGLPDERRRPGGGCEGDECERAAVKPVPRHNAGDEDANPGGPERNEQVRLLASATSVPIVVATAARNEDPVARHPQRAGAGRGGISAASAWRWLGPSTGHLELLRSGFPFAHVAPHCDASCYQIPGKRARAEKRLP